MKGRFSKKMDMNSLLRSRNVLYVVLFLAVANLFSYLMLKQLDAVAFFVIVGLLTTYFSKNMIIVLLTSIITTFFLVQINLLGGGVQEGLEGMPSVDASGNKVDASENKVDEEGASGAAAAASGAAAEAASGAAAEAASGAATANISPPDALSTSEVPISSADRAVITTSRQKNLDGAEKKKEENFTQQLNPARYNASDDDDTPRHKPKVDYAATLESAYDNLDKLLSSDAIRNMSEDTGRLAQKQQLLMGNIEKLTPIMDKASSVLQNLDIGGISGLMGGIQDRMKGFGKESAAMSKKQ